MSRNFVAASSQYLYNTSPLATAAPLTLAVWFKPVGTNVTAGLLGVCKGASNSWMYLGLTNGIVKARTYDGTTSVEAAATTGTSGGTWQHACAVFASASDRRAYYNGGNKGTNATSVTPSGLDRTRAGNIYYSAAEQLFMDGDLAHLAAWSIALSDAEVAQLAAGAVPSTVQGASLFFYAPLAGDASPEPDIVGSFNLTVVGATKGSSDPFDKHNHRMFLVF